MGNIYGYVRVSTREQNEERQLIALQEIRYMKSMQKAVSPEQLPSKIH